MPKLAAKETKAAAKVDPAKVPGKRARKAATAKTGREVRYPGVSVEICVGDGAITAERAKEIIGWQVEEDPKKGGFGNKYLLKDSEGRKVRTTNNDHNRPFGEGNKAQIQQEIARLRWRFNGEPIIVGVHGTVLNGQHTLIALIELAEDYAKHPEKYPELKAPPTIDKLIVYGVDEGDDTVNTMDTCKPRTLADVIYRVHYFAKMPQGDQKKVASVLSQAITRMWGQCGTHVDAYAPKRTHAESIDYLDKHPKLIAAVKHIYEEDNNENKIGKYLKPGYAAAALYLMASSNSESDAYYKADVPSEKLLNFDHWERACEFFVELASGNKTLKAVHDAIGELMQQGAGSVAERWAILAKAWNAYKDKKTVTSTTVKLNFVVTDDERQLAESPLFGGIDVGIDGLPFEELSEGEIDEKVRAVKDKKHGKGKRGKAKGNSWHAGDQAWVHIEGAEPYYATIDGEAYPCKDGVTRILVDGPEGPAEVDVTRLSTMQFELVPLGAAEE